MICFAVLVAFAAIVSTPAHAAPKRVSVVLLPFTGKGVPKKEMPPYEEAVKEALDSNSRFKVRGAAAAFDSLDESDQKAIAKCKGNSDCLTQAAAPLKADIVILGEVSHSGKSIAVKLEAISTHSSLIIVHPHAVVPMFGKFPAAAKAMASEISQAVAADSSFDEPPPVIPDSPPVNPVAAGTTAQEMQADAKPAPIAEPADDVQAKKDAEAAKAAAAHKVRTANGFLFGLEFGGGVWSVSAQKIVSGSNTDLATAQAFTAPMDGHWTPALNLHLGWNILGYASIEAAMQTSFWSVFDAGRGGTGFAGGRATIYPLQFFWVDRPVDLGIEFGGGYTIAGGPTYGMDGKYFQFGVTAEYFIIPSLSVEAFYRLEMPFWNTFYLDYNNKVTFPVSGFSGSFNSLGIGINVHASP